MPLPTKAERRRRSQARIAKTNLLKSFQMIDTCDVSKSDFKPPSLHQQFKCTLPWKIQQE